MGPYCNFCNHRCFTYITSEMWDIKQVREIYQRYPKNIDIIATCRAGQAAEKQSIGICYDEIREMLQQETHVT